MKKTIFKNYVREAECANKRILIDAAHKIKVSADQKDKEEDQKDRDDIKSIIATLKKGNPVCGVISQFIPMLKLRVNPKWGPNVRWEFYTLRNSLNMHIFVSLRGPYFTGEKAVEAAKTFIKMKGLEALFNPDSRVKS